MTENIAENPTPRYVMPREWRHMFAIARAAISRDDLTAASPLLDELASALPEDLEVQLYARWVHDRLAPDGEAADRESLDALAGRALAQHKSLALPLSILGHSAIRRGESIIARRLFRAAIKADPTLLDARRGLTLAERHGGIATHGLRAHRVLVALAVALAAAVGLFAMLSHAADVVTP
jgi:hypothetical protein